MAEQPDDPSPFRPVKLPPFPDSGLIPGASAEDVMGLVVTPPLLAHLASYETTMQARQAEENMWRYGTTTAPEPRGAFGQPPSRPGWHAMPAPFEIRWSYEAWEGCYGEPWAPHWRPWPHEDELRERVLQEFLDAWQIPQPLRDALAAIR